MSVADLERAILAALESGADPAASPMGGAEDFARALVHAPGNFANIGNGDTAVCHSPFYDFDDAAALHGVRYFVALTRGRLPM